MAMHLFSSLTCLQKVLIARGIDGLFIPWSADDVLGADLHERGFHVQHVSGVHAADHQRHGTELHGVRVQDRAQLTAAGHHVPLSAGVFGGPEGYDKHVPASRRGQRGAFLPAEQPVTQRPSALSDRRDWRQWDATSHPHLRATERKDLKLLSQKQTKKKEYFGYLNFLVAKETTFTSFVRKSVLSQYLLSCPFWDEFWNGPKLNVEPIRVNCIAEMLSITSISNQLM